MDEFAMMLRNGASNEALCAYVRNAKAVAFEEGRKYGEEMHRILVGKAIGVDLRYN